MASPSLDLNSGYKMPALGLGTWQSPKGQVKAAVKHALAIGYKHIDCAHIYANEDEVGEAFTEAFTEGTVNREEIFVTSKLWCYDHATEDVLPACKTTLKNLQLDYLDLYLVHNPSRTTRESLFASLGIKDEWLLETWKAMEKLVELGLCRSIGVSNFSVRKLKLILDNCSIKPATNQIEMHPYLPQNGHKKFCEDHGVFVTAYSPLGSPQRPQAFIGADDKELLQEPAVAEVALRRGCTGAQVLIRWALQRNTSVLPKSVTPSRIQENFDSLKVELTADDMQLLDSITTRHRYLDLRSYKIDMETMWDGELHGELPTI